MQDQYVSPQLLWPDVKCASRLTFKGICKYCVKEDSGITDKMLTEYVAPQISGMFGKKVGAILAKPLLWACFDPIYAEMVEPPLQGRIVSQFICLERGLNDDKNPIAKIEVLPNKCTPHDRRFEFVSPINANYGNTHEILQMLLNIYSRRHCDP